MHTSQRPFPRAFQCYKPASEKVYGTICMTPQNRLLLVRGRRSMKWSFPKGHRECGESYLECALRETYEETGIDLEGLVPVSYQKLSVGEYYFFEVDEQLASPVDTREILETRWMTVDDIREAHCNVDVNNFLLRMRRRR